MSSRSTVLFGVPARGLLRRPLQQFASELQTKIAAGLEFSCLITSDDELRRLNRRFCDKDYPTDVLSFPSAERTETCGEVAISFERAREQAIERGHDTAEEIRILMLHGVLHLAGMDHESDKGVMAAAERRWRKHFRLPAGLIERTRP